MGNPWGPALESGMTIRVIVQKNHLQEKVKEIKLPQL